MPDLLYIEASPRKTRSRSIAVARAFLDSYRAANPDAVIDTLDLWAEELPRFDGDVIDAKYTILSGGRPEAAQKEAWRAVEDAVARFTAAKRILFSVPMWNFNVPYVLKHYIDVVTQPTMTFSFSPQTGYRGLIQGTRAAVVYSSAGDYTPGSGNPRPDFQKPFLEAWLRFVGITEIETVTAAPTVGDPARVEAAVAAATERAAEIGRRFA